MGASVHLLAHTGSVWRLRVMQCRRGGRRKEHGKHSPLKTMVDGPFSQVTRSSSKLIQVSLLMFKVSQSKRCGKIGATGKSCLSRGKLVRGQSCQVTPSSFERIQAI